MSSMLSGSALSTSNYDALLIGWDALELQDGVAFDTDTTYCLGANLENPADTLLHILVGVWALAASWKKESSPAMPGAMPGMPA